MTSLEKTVKDSNEKARKKSFLSGFNKLKIGQKIRAIFDLITLVSIIIIGIISFYSSKNALEKSIFDHIGSINETHKQALKEHFENLRNQITTFSSDMMISSAINEFKNAFNKIDVDTLISYSEGDIVNMEANVKNYYTTSFVTPLNHNLVRTETVDRYWPGTNKATILQFQYISNNPNPPEAKKVLNKATDESDYSMVHGKYHPILKDYLEKFELEDIYLVDHETGNIVYSTSKKVDFATNLTTGPYRKSNLALAYELANNSSLKDYVVLVDFEFYDPALGTPSAFLASPVYGEITKAGIIIYQISPGKLNQILSNGNSWKSIGLGETGYSYIVGEDELLRSQSRLLMQDKNDYLDNLRKLGLSDISLSRINNMNSGVLLQPVNTTASKEALMGRSGKERTVDFKNIKVLSAYNPLDIEDVTWGLITEIDQKEAFAPAHKLKWNLLFTMILILILVNIVGYFFTETITERINKLKRAILKLSLGEQLENITDHSGDEIGETVYALNNLTYRLDEASDFAVAIGKGEFEKEFKLSNENDRLGNSLLQMKKSLEEAKDEEQKRVVEDEKRNWATQGIAKFGEILRSDNDNLEKLSYNIISNLVDYLNANQGGIFILNDENQEENFLDLLASKAYDRRKYIAKKILFGEGLVGTCALERKTIYLTEIPDDYINITSGLGEANPKALLIVPLKVKDDILGIIEIASFNQFQPHEIDFVERLAESIATTLTTVRINARTAMLLQESKDKASALAQQEEEMRQNMEEMQATQEELARIKSQEAEKDNERRAKEEKMLKELREQNNLLKESEVKLKKQADDIAANHAMMMKILENIPGKVFVKDHEGKIVIANSATAKLYNKTVEEFIGTSDFDHYPKEEAKKFRDEELKIMKEGKKTWYQEEENQGIMTYLMTTKMPFFIDPMQKDGILGIQIDISSAQKLSKEQYEKKFNEKMKESEKYLSELENLRNTLKSLKKNK